MHQILAAEIQHPNHPDRVARAMRLLTHWSMDQHIDPKQVLETVDRYKNWVAEQFHPTSQQVEVPFTHITADGQQVTGFIDHLIQTANGPVIIDHKTFPGAKSDWKNKTLSYSGQLDLYRKVVQADSPQYSSPSTWIHFVTSGAALQVIT
jgi:ATP-dependent exoDNAse (exonuclease V) beta subunit